MLYMLFHHFTSFVLFVRLSICISIIVKQKSSAPQLANNSRLATVVQ